MMAVTFQALGFLASFLIPLYLIFRAVSKNFFKDYALLYIYLIALMLSDGIRWGAYSVFCLDSEVFRFICNISAVPLILLKFMLVGWLFWIILSNDYPAVRFGFVMIFLATAFVFLLLLAGSQMPNPTDTPLPNCAFSDPQSHDIDEKLQPVNLKLEHLQQRGEYFNVASLWLITILSLIIFVFRLPVGDNLKGIVLGVNAGLILGVVYDSLKPLLDIKIAGKFSIVPLLVMLLIFCRYLSYRKVSESLCIDERLKWYDSKLSEFLIKARLYNAFTNRLFFNFVFEGNLAGQQAFFAKYRDRLKNASRKDKNKNKAA
jgi:hypothetical protein